MKYHQNYKGQSIHDAPIPIYTPEQQVKLDSINNILGKWKRKRLTQKELASLKAGKESPIE